VKEILGDAGESLAFQ
jgi:hypothetical protein